MSIPELYSKTRRNLDALASYLEKLPTDYNHFDMRSWVDAGKNPDDKVIRYAQHNGGVANIGCGSVACAVGHGPAAGVLVDETYITRHGRVLWDLYGQRNFTDCHSVVSMWLFAGIWYDTDNTHRGAAARIRILLNEPEKIPCIQDISSMLWSDKKEAREKLRNIYSDYVVE